MSQGKHMWLSRPSGGLKGNLNCWINCNSMLYRYLWSSEQKYQNMCARRFLMDCTLYCTGTLLTTTSKISSHSDIWRWRLSVCVAVCPSACLTNRCRLCHGRYVESGPAVIRATCQHSCLKGYKNNPPSHHFHHWLFIHPFFSFSFSIPCVWWLINLNVLTLLPVPSPFPALHTQRRFAFTLSLTLACCVPHDSLP